jgi:hypothetical protein
MEGDEQLFTGNKNDESDEELREWMTELNGGEEMREGSDFFDKGQSAPPISRDEISTKYEKIEEYRNQADFMYAFFSAKNQDLKKTHLRAAINLMEQVYGNTPGGVNRHDLETMEYIVNSENTVLMDSLWFVCLEVLPGMVDWFMHGNPVKGELPPPLTNRDMFLWFVRNNVRTCCQKLLNGNDGMRLEEFARELRTMYYVICGIPIPKDLPQHYGDYRVKIP